MTEPPCPNHRVAFYGRTNQTGTDDHRGVAGRYVRCLPVLLRLGCCWLAGWYYGHSVTSPIWNVTPTAPALPTRPVLRHGVLRGCCLESATAGNPRHRCRRLV